MALSTDFKDDILNESVNEKRKYQMTYNDDGTVSFTDVTSYSQTGSEYGAAEVNEERQAINELNSALEKISIYNVSEVSFGYDENAYYIEFSFAADNKFRLFANMTGIAFSRWDGSKWTELWAK